MDRSTRVSRYSPSRGGYFPYAGQVYFGLAVVGKEAVDLLFYIGELRVAEALDGTATQQSFYEGLVAFEELVSVGDGTVAPAPSSPEKAMPPNSVMRIGSPLKV